MAVGTDGAATGYRSGRTLTFWTEVRRQASRRRTQLALVLVAALPVILALAFQFGPDGGGNGGGGNGGGGGDGDGPPLIDLATSGALNFAVFTLLVSASFLLVVLVALFCGDTVASEASWGSLRYLLAAPVPRARLLAVKLAVSLAYCGLALALLTGVALGLGGLTFGWHPLDLPTGGSASTGDGFGLLLGILGYLAVGLLPVAALAFLLSVWTDAPLGAVGGAVLFYITSSILEQVTALGDLRNVLPTRYNTAWLGLLSSPVQTDDMLRGGISALLYATVFLALAWRHFLRKDIVS